jgi:hypothetical protein
MCLAAVSQIVRWLHDMLPRSMHLLMWWSEVLPSGMRLVKWLLIWTSGWVSGGMYGAHLSGVLRQGGVPLCWHGLIGWWHVASACWPSPIRCCHVAHLISSSVLYSLCFLHPVCTQSCCCPQIIPRVALIKSEPLICLFNLLYLPWIYFNSSTCPKILKFSPKIPKFMVINPVIFNSIFSPASLN